MKFSFVRRKQSCWKYFIFRSKQLTRIQKLDIKSTFLLWFTRSNVRILCALVEQTFCCYSLHDVINCRSRDENSNLQLHLHCANSNLFFLLLKNWLIIIIIRCDVDPWAIYVSFEFLHYIVSHQKWQFDVIKNQC